MRIKTSFYFVFIAVVIIGGPFLVEDVWADSGTCFFNQVNCNNTEYCDAGRGGELVDCSVSQASLSVTISGGKNQFEDVYYYGQLCVEDLSGEQPARCTWVGTDYQDIPPPQSGDPNDYNRTFQWTVTAAGSTKFNVAHFNFVMVQSRGTNAVQFGWNLDVQSQCIQCFDAPTVVIQANGSSDSTTIDYNSSATLAWDSTDAGSCEASSGWSGSKSTSGSESTGNLTSGQNFVLTCYGVGGTSASDSVTVNVNDAPAPPPPPPPPPSTGPPPPGVLTCSPKNQTVGVNQTASFSATGGSGGYTWFANDAIPDNGSGSTFSAFYASPDSGKTVRVYSNGVEAQCFVVITSQPTLTPSDPDGFGEQNPDFMVDICMGNKTPPCPHQKVTVPVGYVIPFTSWHTRNGGESWSDVTNSGGWGMCNGSRNPNPNEDFDFDTNYNQSCQAGYCSTCRGARFEPADQTTAPSQPGLFRTIVTNTNDCKEGSNNSGCKFIKASNEGEEEFMALRIIPGPAGWLRCNGQDDACTIDSGQSVTISWQADNMGVYPSNCSIASTEWTGFSGSQNTGPLTATKTYDLQCTRFYGSANEFFATYNDSVTVNVTVLPPEADLRCGNSNGPCNLAYGGTTQIEWCGNSAQTCANASACSVTRNGSFWASGLSGSLSSGFLAPGTYTYRLECTGDGITSDSVDVVMSVPTPTVSNVSIAQPEYCFSGPGGTISWTYSDPANSPQTSYQLQVSTNNGFSNIIHDTGQVNSSSSAYSVPPGVLQFNNTYYTRVRVWNSYGGVSSWSGSSSWSTPPYAYPQVNFTWSPAKPAQNQNAQFTDQTVFGGGSVAGRRWNWTFGDGSTATSQNPQHAYTQTGSYTVSLTATDAANQSCSIQKQLTIQKPIPVIKEVAPK